MKRAFPRDPLGRNWRIALGVLVIIVLTALAFVTPLVVYVANMTSDTYEAGEHARVLGACFGAAAAVFAASAGIAMYLGNSVHSHIERSMAYWRRVNSQEFIEWLEETQARWRDKAPTYSRSSARNDEEMNRRYTMLLYVLDTLDEACAAVAARICHEKTLCFYLGPFILWHAEHYKAFIEKYRLEEETPLRWDCLTQIADRWKTEPKYDKLVIQGRASGLPAPGHA